MNPAYSRSDSWMGKSLVFIMVIVMGLTALSVIGLGNRPKQTVEAAGIQVDVDRKAAELAAEVPGMNALAAARQARELERIQAQQQQEARDRQIYQQAQDEQLRLTQALNNQQIARGELAVAREAKIEEYAIYLGAFALAVLILVVAYAMKRVIDHAMPPPEPRVTIGPGRERVLREPVIIEGQATDVRPRQPTYADSRSHAARRGHSNSSAFGNVPHGNEQIAHSRNRNSQRSIGVPTGQPMRER